MGERLIKSEINIKLDIKSYMDRCGGDYSDWQVGLAEVNDPKLKDLSANIIDGRWIFNTASSGKTASHVLRFLLNLGANGGTTLDTVNSERVIYAIKNN